MLCVEHVACPPPFVANPMSPAEGRDCRTQTKLPLRMPRWQRRLRQALSTQIAEPFAVVRLRIRRRLLLRPSKGQLKLRQIHVGAQHRQRPSRSSPCYAVADLLRCSLEVRRQTMPKRGFLRSCRRFRMSTNAAMHEVAWPSETTATAVEANVMRREFVTSLAHRRPLFPREGMPVFCAGLPAPGTKDRSKDMDCSRVLFDVNDSNSRVAVRFRSSP